MVELLSKECMVTGVMGCRGDEPHLKIVIHNHLLHTHSNVSNKLSKFTLHHIKMNIVYHYHFLDEALG